MRMLTSAALGFLLLLPPQVAASGPAEEADAAIEQWSATYTANDPDALVEAYTPDAILLGTASPVISAGSEAIRKYFLMVKGSGNKNILGERHTIVIDDHAVLVTGFYEFVRMKEGKPI